jgi:hypothetical protein
MGIKVEFNPDLALRPFGTPNRKKEECLPEKLEEGQYYEFLKEGQRNYWLEGEIPLLQTKGNQQLSEPLAAIRIIASTHFLLNKKPYTRGEYLVTSTSPIFESYKRIK